MYVVQWQESFQFSKPLGFRFLNFGRGVQVLNVIFIIFKHLQIYK